MIKKMTIEEEIVKKIVKDLTGRGGLQNTWEDIDSDIQDDIKREWGYIIKEVLERKGLI